MIQNKFFQTSTLPLAAAIICLGISLDSVAQGQDSKTIFNFSRTEAPNLDQIVQDFWRKELRIEPNAFWEAVRFLKGRLHGGPNG